MGFGITYSKPLSAGSSAQSVSSKSEVQAPPAQKMKKLEQPQETRAQEASNSKKAENRERVEQDRQRSLDRSRGQNVDFKA